MLSTQFLQKAQNKAFTSFALALYQSAMLTRSRRALRFLPYAVLFAIFCTFGVAPVAAQPTVDGTLSDAEYTTVAKRRNNNTGLNGAHADSLYVYADDGNANLYIGVKGELPTNDPSNNPGLALWLNLDGLAGDAGDLGIRGGGTDLHYIDGDNNGGNLSYQADFEVDYMFALDSNDSTNVALSVGSRLGCVPCPRAGTEGTCPQDGTSATNTGNSGIFSAGSVTFAFDNGIGFNTGFEIKIPYSELPTFTQGISSVKAAPELFAIAVTEDAYFDNQSVPGRLGSDPGRFPNLGAFGGGPFHSARYQSTTSGGWSTSGTWLDGQTPPSGADVRIAHDVTLDTDASVTSVTIAPGGTFTASDGNGRTLTVGSGGDLINNELNNGTFTASDGEVSITAGALDEAEVSGPITFNDLKVDGYVSLGAVNWFGTVGVNGTLTLTSGQLTTDGRLTLRSTSETSTAAIAGSGSGSVSGDVDFERTLTASGSHFRLLSAPTSTALDDESSGFNEQNLLSNVWTQATGSGADAQVSSASNASVYDYNEGADLNDASPNPANGWTDIQDLDNSVSPGAGVLAYLFADRDPPRQDGAEGFPVTLTATGSVQPEENDGNAITPTITFTGSDGDGTANNGWNLIANPFMAPIDWESIENDGSALNGVDRTIYVYDAANGTYATYTAASSGTNGTTGGSKTQGRYIAPFQAFFVKANGNKASPDIGGIDASDKAIGQSPELKREPTAPPTVKLRLRAEGDSIGETTVFRYSEGASMGKDAYDAYQLQPLDSEYALVASEMGAAESLFDIQSRPVPAEEDTIDLALDLTKSGSYVLEASTLTGLPSEWKVILKNMDSGARYDLGAGETVRFKHPASKAAAKCSSAKDGPSPPVRAMLQNGQPTVAKASGAGDLPDFRLFVGPEAKLPVEWAGFEAKADGQTVALTWRTASETNNAGFAVQRQTAEVSSWTRVGYVESKASGGTTSEPKRYRFTDAKLPFEAEEVTYRLRQEDLDGTTSLSKEVAVQLGAPSKTTLHAPFPNPARRQATLRYEMSKPTDVEIAVYDLLGRRVRTVTNRQVPAGRHETTVQTSGLPASTYFVRMRAGSRVQIRKLTVVR